MEHRMEWNETKERLIVFRYGVMRSPDLAMLLSAHSTTDTKSPEHKRMEAVGRTSISVRRRHWRTECPSSIVSCTCTFSSIYFYCYFRLATISSQTTRTVSDLSPHYRARVINR